jgi:sec-independent protein translocase protein TatC
MEKDESPPLLNLLQRLRKRLVACAIATGVGFIICYIFSETLFRALARPLKVELAPGSSFIYTGLPEMFFNYLKIAFVGGLLLAVPFILYQIWMLAAPSLNERQKRLVLPFVICSSLLFIGGGLFGYFVAFPFGFKFFLGFESEYLQALPSVKQYLSFSIKLLFLFGLVFEFPVLTFFLTKAGVVTPEFLKKNRAYGMLLIFVVAAVITPPDVISQVMLAIPLLLLYEVGIFISRMAVGRKKKVSEGE